MAFTTGSAGAFPPRHSINFKKLEVSRSEIPYLEESFEVLKETASWLALGISVRDGEQAEAVPLNQAICVGQLVRMCKIIRICLRQLVDQHGGDHQMSLSREYIESAATLAYLLETPGQNERFTSFMHDSLIPERERLKNIEENVRHRGGIRLPIEERMERSIRARLSDLGIRPEEIPSRSKNGWPSVETRVNILGPAAYAAYRAGSATVHGNWSDLERNHLERINGGFTPNVNPCEFRPQPLLMMGILGVVVLRGYVAVYLPSLVELSGPRLEDLEERLRCLDAAHESYINGM